MINCNTDPASFYLYKGYIPIALCQIHAVPLKLEGSTDDFAKEMKRNSTELTEVEVEVFKMMIS